VHISLCRVASAPVQLTEAEVAVGDEGAHFELGRAGERLLKVRVGRVDVRPIAMGGDLTQELEEGFIAPVGLPEPPNPCRLRIRHPWVWWPRNPQSKSRNMTEACNVKWVNPCHWTKWRRSCVPRASP
jgi:hypothetical protein